MVDQSSIPDELPDDAIVVRGGEMASDTLDRNIREHARRFPEDPPTLSVASHATWTMEQIVREATFIPHPRIRTSTVGAIRELGHDVVPFGRIPHCNLRLRAPGSDMLYDDLRAVFSESFDKPRVVNP